MKLSPFLPALISFLQPTARRLALMVGFTSVASGLSPAKAAPASQAPPTRSPHTITYDRYSLKIDGKRVFLYSGEIHPFRLPSPSLWRDVLEKIKAAGFDGISVYFDWGYHSPSRGRMTSPASATWIGSLSLRMTWVCT